MTDDLGERAIRDAHRTIDRTFVATPQFVHDGLSNQLGVPVIVKVETVNPIRSFKGRGTWVAVRALAADRSIGPDRPVVCASAGNFGQGVAYAARASGIPAVVFASRAANRAKVRRMGELGARVELVDGDFDDARAAAEAFAANGGGQLLVDGGDVRISTGAATLALELTEAVRVRQLPPPSVISVPVGNGALVNGVGSWMRIAAPTCAIVGVQAERAPAMTLSWRAGRPTDTASADTMADGIATRVAIPLAVELLSGRVDDMILVSEQALRDAQTDLSAALGITVEGAAAASWAGLLAGPRPDGPAVVIVTGSNA
jgi:threonine dehydratase